MESRVCPILPLTCLFILDQVHTLIVWIIMPILLVTIFLSFWLLFALFSILDCYPFLESLLTKQLFVPDYLSQCFSLCYMSTVDCFSVAYNYGTTYTSLDWRHGRRGTGIELGSMQLKVYQQCIFVNYLKASTALQTYVCSGGQLSELWGWAMCPSSVAPVPICLFPQPETLGRASIFCCWWNALWESHVSVNSTISCCSQHFWAMWLVES